MAVAGLHKASGIDSYLGSKERPTTRTSSIRKMWRDLENEGRVKENARRQMSGAIIDPESSCLSFLEGESVDSEDVLMGANEIENEFPQRQNQMALQEKESVRKVFHEWGTKGFGGHIVYGSSHLSSCSRAQWVEENECKRVRIVREWIESSTQQGDTCRTTGSEELTTQTGPQIDGARSSIRRIYGRQALLDLLTKFVRERKREVDELLENRFVSNFGHRHRIQSLLKGRFLLNQRFVEDRKQTSVAASELGFLRQTHAVSDIRKGFLTRLNNYGHAAQSDSDTSSYNEMNNYDNIEQAEEAVRETPHEITENLTSHQEPNNPPESPSAVGAMHDNHILQYEEAEKLPFTVDFSQHGAQPDSDTSSDNDTPHEHTIQVEVGENFETTNFTSNWESANSQEQTRSDSDSETSSDNDHVDQPEEIIHEIPNELSNPQESQDDGGWYLETVGSDIQESHEESWFVGHNSFLETTLVSRRNTVYWSDDDDGSGSRVVELRELTNRRSVSNLLQSDFGARLDQLMQSYVNRQDQIFESENEWMQEHDQQQSLDGNSNDIDASPQTHGDGAANSVFSDSHYHLATELEIINGLRINMETLEQRMNDMQKMLEACMDIQIELQRSVQQEVYLALNRSSNSPGLFLYLNSSIFVFTCFKKLSAKSGSGAFDDGMWDYQSQSSLQNGNCFLCCDDGFESLPDRSAHMLHICSKCAQKVNWSKLKESVRQP